MPAVIPPRPNLREHVYRILKQAILRGKVPGNGIEKLQEASLARALGVSRTPVREALNRLHQEGFITLDRYKGARLAPRSLTEYLQILEVREVLEGLAARLAARRADAPLLVRLRAVMEGFSPEQTKRRAGEYAVANVKFHSLILEASGNPVLARVLGDLYDHMRATRFRIIERLGRGPQSLAEHLEIVEALERRDARKSELMARRHVHVLRAAARRRLGTIEEPSAGRGETNSPKSGRKVHASSSKRRVGRDRAGARGSGGTSGRGVGRLAH